MFPSTSGPQFILSPEDPDSKQVNRSAYDYGGVARFVPRRFRSPPLLGIDIGTAAIKIVELRRSHGGIVLGKIAIAETPDEALSAGSLTNSIVAASAVREALREHGIRCRRAALAVAGAKSRAQCESVPAEVFDSEEALRAFVEHTASSQIDSDVDFAALDYHTVAAPSGGPGTVMWASSGGAEVDWARQAAILAGRLPVLVEPRACSLVNAYLFNHEPEPGHASLLLHAGARWLTMALVLDGRLLYSRDLPLPERGGLQRLPGAALLLGALRPHLHGLAGRSAPAKIERLVMSGTARADQCGEDIHRDTGLMVQQMEPFRRISRQTDGPEGEMVRVWGPLFSVAVGLALRGFEEL